MCLIQIGICNSINIFLVYLELFNWLRHVNSSINEDYKRLLRIQHIK